MRGFPRSLSVRLFMIMLGGVILSVVLTAGLAQRDRSKALRHFRLHAAISHLSDVITLLAPLSAPSRTDTAAGLNPQEWLVTFDPREAQRRPKPVPELAWILSKRLQGRARVESGWVEEPADCGAGPGPCVLAGKTAVVNVRFADGQRLQIGYRKVRERAPPHEQKGFLTAVAVFTGILAAASWWAVRLALRPLRRMTRAAEAFGRDMMHPPLDEAGPQEVKQAAQAFNAMQRQIRHNLAERTRILAAVTHDLKTPLTRMRLRLEQCTDPALQDKLRDDLAAMRALIDEGLELARSLDTAEPMQAVDLGALLQSLCDDAADIGQDVRFENAEMPSGVLVYGRANALRRVFDNLIGNAVKYGRLARLRTQFGKRKITVKIRDAGPGIPEDRLQDVVQPFIRLEDSRSRDSGGTGLGLAIAANLLASQQGKLDLRNLPEGGLEAAVQLTLLSRAGARMPMREEPPTSSR